MYRPQKVNLNFMAQCTPNIHCTAVKGKNGYSYLWCSLHSVP